METYEKFELLRELLSDDTVLKEISNYFSSDQINEFCDSVISDYDLENEFN